MYGIKGIPYPTNLYEVPKVMIGPVFFKNPILQEKSEQLNIDATFTRNNAPPSKCDPLKIGWEFFFHTILVLDTKKDQIVLTNNLSSLTQEGYDIKRYHKVELFSDRGILECKAKGTLGEIRCMLDSGSTWNVLNDLSANEDIWSDSNSIVASSFQLGPISLGRVSFRKHPIKLPIHIEAILGMPFFRSSIVVFDISAGYLYIECP